MGTAGDIDFRLTAGLILKLPQIISYIITGIIIGPFTGGIIVSNIPRIKFLAEIGVALLIFPIGPELSFRRYFFRENKK